MDPALHELYAEGAADDEVAVIVRLADGAALPDGVRIVARFGPIRTCRLLRRDIPRIRAAEAVRSMKAAHLYGPMPFDEDADDTGATELVADTGAAGGPAELEPALNGLDALAGDQRRPAGDQPTGKSTVLAHIDWGIDFAHPDFRHDDGSTRLLALWDQSQPMEPRHPNPYGYGRIYTSAEIDRALGTSEPYAALQYLPADSDSGSGAHGTHTMGISAGNGRSGGPCGMAPDAALVFVQLSTYTADGPTRLGDSVALLEAIDFIGATAGARPFVINASIGRHAGQHDGRTLTEQGMDAFLLDRPGRAIVLSTGNYFDRASHAQGLVRPGDSRTLHLIADSQRRTPTEVDLWYPGTDRLSVTVNGPDGLGSVRAGPGSRASIVIDGREVGRLYHRVDDPNNGDCQVTLLLYAAAPPAHWTITLHGDDVTDGRYHAWVERNPVCGRCQAHFTEDDCEPTGTTGTICNGLRTIAVGAYNAHRQERPLARFSSCGPTRDGRQKPDLIAPGVRVLAARSCPRGMAAGLGWQTRMSGTSMACPHVAGLVALMFEAAGRPLSIDETRRVLLGVAEEVGADADPVTLLRTGSGVMDALAAIGAARRLAAPSAPATPLTQLTRTTIMNDDNEEASGAAQDDADQEPARRERSRGRARENAALPFQVQLPIGGGAPALAVPIGGAGSPFAFSLPLGGQSTSPAPAPPAPALPVYAAAPAYVPAPAGASLPPAAPALVEPNDPVAALRSDVQFYTPPEAAGSWADSAAPGARSMLRLGARGPGVQDAQHKLNLVHQRQRDNGSPGLAGMPLVEDGVFGPRTHQATVSFQQLAFPGQPQEWDGVIGPKSWAMLDLMSAAAPSPPAPAPKVEPPSPAPRAPHGCGNLTVWINAFIPRDVPGYTITVPMGSHAGKTAIPCPWQATPANGNCLRLAYLTDQRGFDQRPGAPVRMRSLAEVALLPPRLVRQVHETSGTVEVNKFTGVETCAQSADMRRCRFSMRVQPVAQPPGSFKIVLDYAGAGGDPCVNLAADIDYSGQIELLCIPSRSLIEVRVAGFVDAFPAFEMYASLGGTTHTLFTLAPPAGNTVIDLLGGASTPVAGLARFGCSFGQSPEAEHDADAAAFENAQLAAEAAVQVAAETEAAYTQALLAAIEKAAIDTESAWQTEGIRAGYPQDAPAPDTDALPPVEQTGDAPERGQHAAAAMRAGRAAECSCGDQRLARADAFARAPAGAPQSAGALIEALLKPGGDGQGEMDESDLDGGGTAMALRGRALTPTGLFKLLAQPDPGGSTAGTLAMHFDVIARPGERLTGIVPRAGDLLIRVARAEGWGNVSVVASNGVQPLHRLPLLGLRAEGGNCGKPGRYLHVVEILPRALSAATGMARRLADADDVVLADSLLLRPRTTGGAAEAEAPGRTAPENGASYGSVETAAGGARAAAFSEQLIAPLCDTLSQFARDSDTLLAAHRGQIGAAAQRILARGVTNVIVTGFASTDGSSSHNLALGMRRAQRVSTELRTALERQRPGSSARVTIIPASRGEYEQIDGGAATLNRRVTICPSAPARPQAQPPTLRQKVFRVTAKSFIGRIGSSVGSLSCGLDTRFGHIPSPATNPALRGFAALTDVAFSENPGTDGIFVAPPPDSKGYRLFSSARVQVEHRGTQLLSAAVVGALLTDAGKECLPGVGLCLQAPPLIVDIAPTFTRIDASRVRITWGVRGRPPAAAEPAFDAICNRSCVFIWHRVKATIDCSSGVPVMSSMVIEGSRFPSHRLWLDGVQAHNVVQGPFSNLWDEQAGDPTLVR